MVLCLRASLEQTWKAKELMPDVNPSRASLQMPGPACLGKSSLGAFPESSSGTRWGFRLRRWVNGCCICLLDLNTAWRAPRAPAPASVCPNWDLAADSSTSPCMKAYLCVIAYIRHAVLSILEHALLSLSKASLEVVLSILTIARMGTEN